MAQSITEVILGTGNLFVASETDINAGTAEFPTNPATTPSASYWDNIGYSEGGFSLEYDKTFEDIMVA